MKPDMKMILIACICVYNQCNNHNFDMGIMLYYVFDRPPQSTLCGLHFNHKSYHLQNTRTQENIPTDRLICSIRERLENIRLNSLERVLAQNRLHWPACVYACVRPTWKQNGRKATFFGSKLTSPSLAWARTNKRTTGGSRERKADFFSVAAGLSLTHVAWGDPKLGGRYGG